MSLVYVLHYISMTIFLNCTLLKLQENVGKQPLWKERWGNSTPEWKFYLDCGFGQTYP